MENENMPVNGTIGNDRGNDSGNDSEVQHRQKVAVTEFNKRRDNFKTLVTNISPEEGKNNYTLLKDLLKNTGN